MSRDALSLCFNIIQEIQKMRITLTIMPEIDEFHPKGLGMPDRDDPRKIAKTVWLQSLITEEEPWLK
jgi:hypothetical protein